MDLVGKERTHLNTLSFLSNLLLNKDIGKVGKLYLFNVKSERYGLWFLKRHKNLKTILKFKSHRFVSRRMSE